MRSAAKAATVLATALVVAWCPLGGRSPAGPARYDQADKSFSFTYTFAAMIPEQMGTGAIGAPQTPSPEQNARVRALLKEVSDALSQATGGRARIARLDMVDDIKGADIVISLTGQPQLHAWAIQGAVDGKPGQIAFFYNSLANQTVFNHRDVVLTAVHEMGHYIFGLADEYMLNDFPGGCPLANPGGPGCLMDNYNTNGSRHGWYGRFCQDDHNSRSRQPKSCQAIVDQFFRDRGDPKPAVTQTEEQVVTNLASAALGKAREEVAVNSPTASSTQARLPAERIRERARTILSREVIQQGLRRVTSADMSKALRFFGDLAGLVPVPKPVRIGEDLSEELLNRARELAAKDKESGRTATTTEKEARIRRIKEALFSLVRSRLGGGTGLAPGANVNLSAEEMRFVDSLARAVSDDSQQSRNFDTLMKAAWEHIQLDLETARNVVETGDVIGVPGTANRLQRLAGFEQRFKDLYLPGRTYPRSRFGFRRTLIIAPDPLNERYDLVYTQSGVRRYEDLREACVRQFARLIDRERIEPLIVSGENPVVQRLLAPGLEQPPPPRDPQQPRNRFAELQGILAQVVSEIRKNSLENVILFVPPDGLPDDFGRSVEGIREQVLGRTDVRLDIVLIGPATIPAPLRDLAERSGGAVLANTDIDEMGALAQRLKNEQAAGSWVILPRQGVVRGDGDLQDEQFIALWPTVRTALDDLKAERPEYTEIARRLLQDTLERFERFRRREMGEIIARSTDREAAEKWVDDIQKNLGALERNLVQLESNSARLREVVDTDPGEAARLAAQVFPPAFEARETLEAVQSYLASLEQPLDTRPLRTAFESGLTPEERNDEAVSVAIEERLAREPSEPRAARPRGAAEKHTELDPFQEAVRVLQRIADRAIDRLGEIIRPRPTFTRLDREEAQRFLRRAEMPRDALVVDELQDRSRRDDRVLDEILRLSRRLEEVAAADESKASAAAAALQVEKAVARAKEFNATAAGAAKAAADAEVAAAAARKLARARAAEASKKTGDAKAAAKKKADEAKSVADALEDEASEAEETSRVARADAEGATRLADAAVVDARKAIEQRPRRGSVGRASGVGTPGARPSPIKLARFYAERGGSFELILGSTRPLPGSPVGGDPFPREEERERYAQLPRLRLFTDDGAPVEAPSLRLDATASTPTILVYRLRSSPTFEGRFYNVELLLSPDAPRSEADINYTFSIASSRPNVELIASLVQAPPDLEIDPPPSDRGLVRAELGRARIEVQVLGGVSILNARVNGFLQKFDLDVDPIDLTAMTFADDGLNGDRTKDDGIYTAIIPIDRLADPAEYRVGIQAMSTEDSKNIQPEDPFQFEEQRRREARRAGLLTARTPLSRTSAADPVRDKLAEKALQFERATSLHFRVER